MISIEQQSEAVSPSVTRCWVRITRDDTSKDSVVRSGRHGKAGCYRCCIRDAREYLMKQKTLPEHNVRCDSKMESVADWRSFS